MKQPEVVVFSGPSTGRSPALSKLQAKAFMVSSWTPITVLSSDLILAVL